MMKNIRLKSFLLPGIIVLVILGITILFLWPKIGEISKLRKKLVKDKNLLVQLTAKVTALEGLGKGELKTKAEKVAAILPVDKDVPLILTVLKNLASQANVSLTSSSVNPGELATSSAQPKSKKETGLPSLAFKLTLTGKKDDLENFLQEVERVSPLMRIEAFSFSQDRSGDDFEAELSLNSFFLSLPQNLGSVETPVALLSPQEETVYQQLVTFKSMVGIETLPLIQSGKENLFAF